MEVIRIDFPPHRDSKYKLSRSSTKPPGLSEDPAAASQRERIPPPKESFDFLPDLIKEKEGDKFQLRDVKPLHIIQPDGVGFTMRGNELEWQKWKMHICMCSSFGAFDPAHVDNL